MKKNIFRPLLALALIISLFSSCKKEKEIESKGNTTQSGTMSCKINGVEWHATSFNNTLLKESGTKRIDIRGIDAKGNQLILTMGDHTNSVSGDGIKLDDYYMDIEENYNYDTDTYDKSGIGTFYKSQTNYFMTITSSGPNDHTSVTACDGAKRTISGTFQFEAYNGIKDSIIVITDGVFETEY